MSRPALARARTPSAVASHWGWAWAGATLGLVLALVGFAPAHWLTQALQQASGGRLVLDDPRGTVWDGSARLVLTGGAGSSDAAALPGRIDWQLRPRLNGLRARVGADCCTREPLQAHITPGFGGATLTVGDHRSQWPAAVLTGLGTPWNTLQVDGQIHLSTQALSVEWAAGRLALGGRAQIDAMGISSRLSTLRPMGSYRITLNGGSVATLQLDTLDGSLQLSGTGRWVGSRLRFEGTATATPEREAALSNLLNIIGRRNGARSLITIG